MKIGIFTDIYKPTINGITISIDTFKESLEQKGHQVYIFAPTAQNAQIETNVFRLPAIDELSPKDFPIAMPFLPALAETILKLKIDVVHIQLPFTVGFIGHRIAKRYNIPEIHTYHTLLSEYSHYVPSELLQPLVRYGLKKLSKNFCNAVDINIAPSTSMKELLLSYGVKKPIIVNPTGIQVNNYKRLNEADRRELFKKYHIPTDKFILLFAGRIAQEKNLTFLLDCFRDILKEKPKTHLVFAGGGFPKDEKKLKTQIKKLGLEQAATVTGYLEKPEIAKFFGAGDIFTFPSVTETQGIVLAEAMAGGTPVVAMNVFGPKDIIKNNIDGFLCKHNKKDFTGRTLELMNNEKLRKDFTREARQNVQRFSIEACTDRLISIYERGIERKLRREDQTIWRRFMNH